MAVATTHGMDDDRRYERPCKRVLAVAGGIHWIAAAIVLLDSHVEDQVVSRYAQLVNDLVTAIGHALS